MLTENLKELLGDAYNEPDYNNPRPRLLFFDSGCHDLAFNNTAYYMTHFQRALDNLQIIKNTGKFNIIYQNIPPWPHLLEHSNNRHLNSFMNAATAYWIKTKMDEMDIPVIDIQRLALPFEDMSTCGMHFLCHAFPKEHTGPAGREAAQQALALACGEL